MDAFNSLYQCTYEYQINNFWKIFKECITSVLNNTINNNITKDYIIMLNSFIGSDNKEIRKLSFLSLSLLLYFAPTKELFYKTFGLFEKNGLIVLSTKNKQEDKIIFINKFLDRRNISSKIYSKNKNLNKQYDFIWYFDNKTIRVLTMSQIKEIYVNEDLSKMFDCKKYISGIIGIVNPLETTGNINNFTADEEYFTAKKIIRTHKRSKSIERDKNKSPPKINFLFLKSNNNNSLKNKSKTKNYYENILNNNFTSNFINQNVKFNINNGTKLNNKLNKIINYKKKSKNNSLLPKINGAKTTKNKNNSISFNKESHRNKQNSSITKKPVLKSKNIVSSKPKTHKKTKSYFPY